jgi:hypothetical protein
VGFYHRSPFVSPYFSTLACSWFERASAQFQLVSRLTAILVKMDTFIGTKLVEQIRQDDGGLSRELDATKRILLFVKVEEKFSAVEGAELIQKPAFEFLHQSTGISHIITRGISPHKVT